MADRVVPVILAGGKGTRLWPLSRASSPKQFIRFGSNKTLFQEALGRVSNLSFYEPPLVVTNEEFRFLAAEQARAIGITVSAILLEPVARNTGPAIAAAAAFALERFGEGAILKVLASDHEIAADGGYSDAMYQARATVLCNKLVAIGITPTEPATGYGYIEVGEQLISGAYNIKRFVEKPTFEEAEKMLGVGNFVWNSGIFMFFARQILNELGKFAPIVSDSAAKSVANASRDLDFLRLDSATFASSPDISIDFAVMEKTIDAAVVPSTFGWSDMGSWDAVWKMSKQDEAGNVTSGHATVLNTKNSLVMSRACHLAVQGLDGVAVIASEDAVYVGRLDESQHVRDLVRLLASEKDTAALTQTHPTAYRPWGGYTSVLNGDRFQVKRLFVTPGKKLSLQTHQHRSEHWICVKGTAEVTVGDDSKILRENESVFIPQGQVHRLANPGKIVLEMIEVQTGSYLGEDDITRIDDEFGRK